MPQLLESVLAHLEQFGMTMKCVVIDHQDILLQGLQPRSCHILSFYFSYPFIFPILYSLPPHFGLVVTNGQWFVEIAIFYTLRKLFCGLMCEMSEKKLQFNFSSQNLIIEHNFLKSDGKITKVALFYFHTLRSVKCRGQKCKN